MWSKPHPVTGIETGRFEREAIGGTPGLAKPSSST